MATGVTKSPRFLHLMHRLEATKRKRVGRDEYWLAREIAPLLGYDYWANFVPVIERAKAAIEGGGDDPSHHIARTSKMMGIGKSGQRRVEEFFLSRGACYLIAMNGDPGKPAIAAAQTYFAGQARIAELYAQANKDRKRVEQRSRLKDANKRIAEIAKDVGVARYGIFHDAKYRGLYGMSAKAVARHKEVREGESLLDRAAALELSAHEFQANLAAQKILNEGIVGETDAVRANREVAERVRAAVIRDAGCAPEDLPIEPDTVADAERRLAELKRLPNN